MKTAIEVCVGNLRTLSSVAPILRITVIMFNPVYGSQGMDSLEVIGESREGFMVEVLFSGPSEHQITLLSQEHTNWEQIFQAEQRPAGRYNLLGTTYTDGTD